MIWMLQTFLASYKLWMLALAWSRAMTQQTQAFGVCLVMRKNPDASVLLTLQSPDLFWTSKTSILFTQRSA